MEKFGTVSKNNLSASGYILSSLLFFYSPKKNKSFSFWILHDSLWETYIWMIFVSGWWKLMGSSSAIELSHVDQLTRNQLTFGMEVRGHEEARWGSYQTRRDDFYCNRERGPALLPQRKENPQWNEYSSQRQHNSLGALEQTRRKWSVGTWL